MNIGKAPEHLRQYPWYLPHQAWLAASGNTHHDPEGAELSRANLSGANLIGASLIGVNLSRANLSGANLSDADLIGARHIVRLPVGDPRGYDAVAILDSTKWSIASGCRWLQIEEARRHWGKEYTGDREIGDLYLRALDWLAANSERLMTKWESDKGVAV